MPWGYYGWRDSLPMIAQIYAAAKRHKEELSCTLHIPVVPTSSSAAERLGASPTFTDVENVRCLKGTRRRLRESSDGGATFTSTFPLLLELDVACDISPTSLVELLNKTYRILSSNHDKDQLYWRLDLRDE